MSFSHNRTEEYYKRFIELQEKLRKSEEERLKLEMKFNEMVTASREETQTHYRKLRSQYKRFLEEDRRRQERNERIMRTLERIESRFSMLVAKTDRFKQLREQYQNLLKRMYRDQKVGHKKSAGPQLESSAVHHRTPAVVVENHDDIVKKYLESVSSETLKNLLQKKEQRSEFKRRTPFTLCSDPVVGDENKNYHENFSHAYREGEFYKPNRANFIAEDIMSSIYNSRQARPTTAVYVENPKSSFASDIDRNEFCGATNLNFPKSPPKTSTANLEKQEQSCGTLDSILGNVPNGFDQKIHHLVRSPELNSDYSDADDDLSDSKEIDTRKLNPNQQWNKLRDKLPQLYDKSLPSAKYIDRNPRKLDIEVFSSPQKIDLVEKSQEELPLAQPQYIGEPLEDRESHKTGMKSSQDKRNELLRKLEHNVDPRHNVEPSFQLAVNAAQGPVKEIQPKSPSLNQQYESIAQKMKIVQPASCAEDEKLPEGNQPNDQPLNFPQSLEIEQSSVAAALINKKPTTSNDPHEQIDDQFRQETGPSAGQISDDSKIRHYQYETDHKFEIHPENDSLDKYYASEPIDQGSAQYDANNVQPIIEQHDITAHSKVIEDPSYVEPAQDAQQFDERYEQDIQPTQEQSYDQNVDQADDTTTKEQLEVQYDQEGAPITRYDSSIRYDETGQVIQNIQPTEERYDLKGDQSDKAGENEELEIQYDQSGQPIQYDETGQVMQNIQSTEEQYDSNTHQSDEATQEAPLDQNDQSLYDPAAIQYDENGQPIMPYDDQLQQQQYMYDENGQLIPQYDESGQLIQQYDESGQLIQPQYDANGQYIQQYDENGQPIYQYDDSGQPIYQYDESGQMVQEYDENGIPVQQYDENGQLIQQYGESEANLQQYDESGVSVQQNVSNSGNIEPYEEMKQPIQQHGDEAQTVSQYNENHQDVQQHNEVEQQLQQSDPQILEEASLQNVEKLDSADIVLGPTSDVNSPPPSAADVEPHVVSEDVQPHDANMLKTPNQPKNVMEMLDTDTENSLRQEDNTKISHDSDFDFSNG